MVLQVDLTSDEPLYRQIRAQIVHAVAAGELTPGDPLPSVRALAGDLGINMHTVNKAYAVLRDEGYLSMRGRRGAVIADVTQATSSARAKLAHERVAEELKRLAIEFMSRGGSSEEFGQLAREQAEAAFSSREGEVR